MNIFREIRENNAAEKTDMEFHSFDHTVGFLFLQYVFRYGKIYSMT